MSLKRILSITRLLVPVFAVGLFSQGCTTPQTQFPSPDAAVQSVVRALRTNDETALRRAFGSDADELMLSGDPVADQNRREKFLAAYDVKNQLVPDSDDPDSVTLNVGAKDWPLPIPIVKNEKTGQWQFDTAAGKEEIINRRIGENELDVIEVCKAFVDAQREYAERDPNNDGIPEYAQKVISDPGTRNGLYWETKEGEPPSPLGPGVADAVAEGYSASPNTTNEPRPFHGYCYRLLKSQGPNTPGGALDYVINGKMIGGFAVVAYPADYGNSGIMTFLVSYEGVVFQKDLGSQTARSAKQMTAFDPDGSWQRAEPAPPATQPAEAPAK